METRLALIGFGEAARAFAPGLSAMLQGYDRLIDDGDMRQAMSVAGVAACDSASAALTDADAALSLVTADQALAAARAAGGIAPGALWLDMNSVAPETKRAACRAVTGHGGRYVDVAIMAPVQPRRTAVPLLVSGAHAEAGRTALTALGFIDVRIVGEDVGRASTIKMLRSVIYKGVEALTAECLIACERAGVTDEVLASFGDDWATGADYRLDRMLVHGLRRAAEMHESSETLRALGVSPMMTENTVRWQQGLGELGISPVPEGLGLKLDAILRSPRFKGEI